jgi:hypothetical protein
MASKNVSAIVSSPATVGVTPFCGAPTDAGAFDR